MSENEQPRDEARSAAQRPALTGELADAKWYLVWSHGDGYHSRLCKGEASMRRAWLEMHFGDVDFDRLTEEQDSTLSIVDDDEYWSLDDDGHGVCIDFGYEDGRVGVMRIEEFDATANALNEGVPKALPSIEVLGAERPGKD